jgi:hypothetical protein
MKKTTNQSTYKKGTGEKKRDKRSKGPDMTIINMRSGP